MPKGREAFGNGLLSIAPSSLHGTGVFAARALASGTRLLEYLGERIDKAEANRRCAAGNQFIFYLDEQYNLDGDVSWNHARFFNHSCAPNCEAQHLEGGIWIVALRDLEAGEELTFNYGFDLESYRDYPCRCEAENCVGYMVAEEYFPLVRARENLRAEARPGG